MEHNPFAVARAKYQAYVHKDRAAIEGLIAEDFHFTSPLDNRIDRPTYFVRCCPNSTMKQSLTRISLHLMAIVYSSPMRRKAPTASVSATVKF
jgi:hypothetical protein